MSRKFQSKAAQYKCQRKDNGVTPELRSIWHRGRVLIQKPDDPVGEFGIVGNPGAWLEVTDAVDCSAQLAADAVLGNFRVGRCHGWIIWHRGSDSNGHERFWRPSSCQLDDPDVLVRAEGFEPITERGLNPLLLPVERRPLDTLQNSTDFCRPELWWPHTESNRVYPKASRLQRGGDHSPLRPLLAVRAGVGPARAVTRESLSRRSDLPMCKPHRELWRWVEESNSTAGLSSSPRVSSPFGDHSPAPTV